MTKSILLVEDNTTERRGLSHFLTSAGYGVTEAVDGKEALALLAADKPDLVLLDMMMSNGDGWYFLERRAACPEWLKVPVLVVTGLTVASEGWAADIGANGLLRKPIADVELLAKVKRFAGA